MKYILDAMLLQAELANMSPEDRGKYIMDRAIDLCSGKETAWAKIPPKPRSKKAIGPYSDDFLMFWDVYPKSRKTSKGGAYIAWKEIIKYEPAVLIKILDALSWQVLQEEWIIEGGKWIPNPETYLIKRRWEDEKPAPPDKPKRRYQDMNGVWREE